LIINNIAADWSILLGGMVQSVSG